MTTHIALEQGFRSAGGLGNAKATEPLRSAGIWGSMEELAVNRGGVGLTIHLSLHSRGEKHIGAGLLPAPRTENQPEWLLKSWATRGRKHTTAGIKVRQWN